MFGARVPAQNSQTATDLDALMPPGLRRMEECVALGSEGLSGDVLRSSQGAGYFG